MHERAPATLKTWFVTERRVASSCRALALACHTHHRPALFTFQKQPYLPFKRALLPLITAPHALSPSRVLPDWRARTNTTNSSHAGSTPVHCAPHRAFPPPSRALSPSRSLPPARTPPRTRTSHMQEQTAQSNAAFEKIAAKIDPATVGAADAAAPAHVRAGGAGAGAGGASPPAPPADCPARACSTLGARLVALSRSTLGARLVALSRSTLGARLAALSLNSAQAAPPAASRSCPWSHSPSRSCSLGEG